MKHDQSPDLRARKGVARHATFAGETETWIDAAAPTLAEAEKLHAVYSAAPELLEACKNLLAIVRVQNGNLHDDVSAIQAAAEAAIAKAEGRAE